MWSNVIHLKTMDWFGLMLIMSLNIDQQNLIKFSKVAVAHASNFCTFKCVGVNNNIAEN